jgi:hypothetical protein
LDVVVEEGRLVRGREFVVGEVHVAVMFLNPFRFSFGFAVLFIAFYPFEYSGWFAEVFAGHYIFSRISVFIEFCC